MNEQPIALTAWQIIGLVFGIFGALWLLVQDVRNNYLTIREHTEFATRTSNDVTRIENNQRADSANGATIKDIARIDAAIAELRMSAIERAKSYVTRDAIAAHIERDKDTLASVQREIDGLRALINGNVKPPLDKQPK